MKIKTGLIAAGGWYSRHQRTVDRVASATLSACIAGVLARTLVPAAQGDTPSAWSVVAFLTAVAVVLDVSGELILHRRQAPSEDR